MGSSVRITTKAVDADQRTEFWREVTRPVFETIAEDRAIPLEGSLAPRPVGGLLIGPTSFNAQRSVRSRRLIAAGGLDQYMVQLFIDGSAAGDCDGTDYRAGPGDICIRDLSLPFDSTTTPGSTVTVVVPRERVDRRLGGLVLHGCVLPAGDPLTRLLADFIISLAQIADGLDDADALAVEDSAVELIVAVALRRHASAASPAAGQVLRPRILDFIDQHLFEHGLGPRLLVERFHVSRAHLYRMFETDGGVASVIRNRRLDAAMRELTGPRRRSLTAISHDLGFSSSSQFSRAFRARFDCTPSEAVQRRAAPADAGLNALHRHFAGHAR